MMVGAAGNERWQFTSESVSEGHPDKVADRISDEVLDAALRVNPKARAAIETLVTSGRCIVAGEVDGVELKDLDIPGCIRKALQDIGYGEGPFRWDPGEPEILVHAQSREISDAVVNAESGAGDQGLMFGYACRETPELMPAALYYSHRLVARLAELRKSGEHRLGPDAKSQVTLTYEGQQPVSVNTVVVSHQHAAEFAELPRLVRAVIEEVFPQGMVKPFTKLLINPSGSFTKGGPEADTGLTGRKIIVDTYGGAAPHGGGAFSGKDATKVDRSAAYAARWLAKNVVSAGIADRCLIQLAYAIGVAEPVSVVVNTFGTTPERDYVIERAIRRVVDLRPKALRERLGLDQPIFARTAAYGHFGRAPDADGGFSWERTDLGEEIIDALG